MGQGPLLSLPSPCSCQRCYRKVRIHSVTPSALRCMLREGSRGIAHAGWNVGISSTSGGNNSPLFLFPDNMWEEPVCWPCLQPSSSPCLAPAGSVLLPGRLSLTLAVSTAALCTEISTECLEQGRCCSWGQGAQIHYSSPPLPECRLRRWDCASPAHLDPWRSWDCTYPAHPRCFGLWQLSLPTYHSAASSQNHRKTRHRCPSPTQQHSFPSGSLDVGKELMKSPSVFILVPFIY